MPLEAFIGLEHQRMPRETTRLKREKILDAAELLFSERGFFGVSVRDITNHVGSRLAAVNYHFDSKENLFIEVLIRRIQPLSQARLARLDAIDVEAYSQTALVEAIVRAFVEPMIDFCLNDDPGWRHYCRLVAQVIAQQYWSNSPTLNVYDQTALRFIEVFKQIGTHEDDYAAQVSFQMMLANTLYLVSDNGRLDRLSKGNYTSSDFEALLDPYVSYVTAGIQKLLAC